MLKLNSISKTFRSGVNVSVLRSVTLALRAGEIVALTGANGSGKSTILRIIAGDLQPDTGDVLLNDQVITGTPPHRRARAIGLVHQDSYRGLAVELRVADLLGVALKRNGRLSLKAPDGREAINILSGAIPTHSDTLGFYVKRSASIASELSGGERQLLALLIAVLGGSKVLLLDEHRSNLDPERAAIADALLIHFVARGGCILAVIHDPNWQNDFADRKILLRNGLTREC